MVVDSVANLRSRSLRRIDLTFADVFRKTLRDQHRALVGWWGTGIAVMVLAMAALWGIPARHAAIGVIAVVLLGIQHAWLALAIGAAAGRRGLAIPVPGTLAVMGYVLHVIGALVDAVEPWQPLSPFTQAIEAGPISGRVTRAEWTGHGLPEGRRP